MKKFNLILCILFLSNFNYIHSTKPKSNTLDVRLVTTKPMVIKKLIKPMVIKQPIESMIIKQSVKPINSKCIKIEKYSCDICKKEVTSHTALISHKKIHNPEQLYACYLCNNRYNYKHNLIRHIKTHSFVSEKFYTCYICNQMFTQKGSCNRHIKSHMEIYIPQQLEPLFGDSDILNLDAIGF